MLSKFHQLTVKIARVFLVLQVWYKLRLLSQQAVPVKTFKEDVLLHLLSADCAEPLQRIVLEKANDHIFGIVWWTVLSLFRPFDTLCPSNYMKHQLQKYLLSFHLLPIINHCQLQLKFKPDPLGKVRNGLLFS